LLTVISRSAQPLPPVPSAAAFPATGSAARSSQVKDPSPLVDCSAWSAPKDDLPSDRSSFSTPSLNVDHALQLLPQTPRLSDPSAASVPKSKGKTKVKKWTDPPIFQGEQNTAAEEQPKTLFSFHDTAETPNSDHTEAPEHKNNDAKNMSPIRDVTNHMTAQKPTEIKQGPSISQQVPSTSLQNAVSAGLPEGSLQAFAEDLVAESRKRSLRENSHDLYEQVDENQPPMVNPTQAKSRTAPGPVFRSTQDDMKSMLMSVAPKSNCAAKDTIKSNEGSAPVVFNVGSNSFQTSSPGLAPAPAPAHVDKAPKSVKSGRIAKGSAIKKITESSSEPPIATKPSDTTPMVQSPTPSAQDQYPLRKAPVSSTASSAAASQVPRVLAPAARVTSPPVFTPNMSASAPAFQPSGPSNQSHTTAPGGSSFASSLMAKMTPEQAIRFRQQMGSMA
jgi:hypothetical protein